MSINQVTKQCIVCGSIFKVRKDRENTAKFCSRKCYHEGQTLKLTSHHPPHYAEFICRICGNSFQIKRKTLAPKRYIYCSQKCYNQAQKTGRSFRDKTEQSEFARQRKSAVCALCGYKRFIETAHIIPACNNGKHRADNIMFLCPNHHRLFDSHKLNKRELAKLSDYAFKAYSLNKTTPKNYQRR